jgi:hypothetical protein
MPRSGATAINQFTLTLGHESLPFLRLCPGSVCLSRGSARLPFFLPDISDCFALGLNVGVISNNPHFRQWVAALLSKRVFERSDLTALLRLWYSRARTRSSEALDRRCGQFPAFLDPVSPALPMSPSFQVGGSPPFQFAFEVGILPDHAGRNDGPSRADDPILNDGEALPVPTDPA